MSEHRHDRPWWQLRDDHLLVFLLRRNFDFGKALTRAGQPALAVKAFSSAIDISEKILLDSCGYKSYRNRQSDGSTVLGSALRTPCVPRSPNKSPSGKAGYAAAIYITSQPPVSSVGSPSKTSLTPIANTAEILAQHVERSTASIFDELIDVITAESRPRVTLQRARPLPPSIVPGSQMYSDGRDSAHRVNRATLLTIPDPHASYNRLAYKVSRAIGLLHSRAICRKEVVRLRLAAVHERGKVFQELNQHIAAIADFTDVLCSSPGTTAAFFRRGLSLRSLRCFMFAADDLETARTSTPRDDRFNVNYHDLTSGASTPRGCFEDEHDGSIVGLDGDAESAVSRLFIGAD